MHDAKAANTPVMSRLRIRRIAYALGAEITGVDLSETLDDATIVEIRAAWLDHQVLCFPDQPLAKKELVAFASRFGEPLLGATRNPDPETPHIKQVTNKALNGKPGTAYKDGHNWHIDKSYLPQPTSASFLGCGELPPVGGDTMFANMYLAFETLSPAMQRLAESLSALHTDKLRPRSVNNAERTTSPLKVHPAVQPVVQVHPETGRKSLYLGYRTSRFAGMSEEESLPIMDFLNAHATRYEFTYRHRWTKNDLIMWDNRCLMHIALSDYDLARDIRYMFGVELKGTPTGRLADATDEPGVAAAALAV